MKSMAVKGKSSTGAPQSLAIARHIPFSLYLNPKESKMLAQAIENIKQQYAIEKIPHENVIWPLAAWIGARKRKEKVYIHIEREFAFYLTRDMDAIRDLFSCVPLSAIASASTGLPFCFPRLEAPPIYYTHGTKRREARWRSLILQVHTHQHDKCLLIDQEKKQSLEQ